MNTISANIYTPGTAAFGTGSAQESSSHIVSTKVTAATDTGTTDTGVLDLGVQISSRTERMSENQAIAAAQTNDALTSLAPGSRRQVSPEHIGASNQQYSLTRELAGVDYGSNVDTAGGPFDVIDKVLAALNDLGESALLAQTNLLPTDSPFWVSAQPSLLGLSENQGAMR